MTEPTGSQHPTLQDIADACGVSARTVSNVLRNTGRVSPATRQQILRKAAELRYRPNQLARALRTGRTHTLGVVARIGDGRLPETFAALDEGAAAHGYRLLLASSHSGPEAERAAIESLLERSVDGLVIFPLDDPANAEYLLRLVAETIPLVFAASYDLAVEGDFVVTDNERAGVLAAHHLLARGRRRVAFVTSLDPQGRAHAWAQARRRGLDRGLTQAGAAASLLLSASGGDWQPAAAQAMREYLTDRGTSDLDAVFGANDAAAAGAMQALQERGLQVPAEIAVVGFDDEPWATYLRPTLTTFRRPDVEIGRQCIRLLVERIRSGNRPLPPRRVLLEPCLLVRESSGGA